MNAEVIDHPTRSAKPQPAVSIPKAPAFLTPFAKREWKRITAELAALQLIAEIDRAVLAAYCSAWGKFEEAERQMAIAAKREGALDKTGLVHVNANGYVSMSTWSLISRNSAAEAAKLAVEFGGSARARAKVKADDTKAANRGRVGRPAKQSGGLSAFGRRD